MSKSPDDFAEEFDRKASLYELLHSEARFALESALREASVKPHMISGRVKEKASFIEKNI